MRPIIYKVFRYASVGLDENKHSGFISIQIIKTGNFLGSPWHLL